MSDGKLAFVSYSQKDKPFLEEQLLPFLKPMLRHEQIELWHDQLIGVGENWYAEIADRLDHAKVAILVVTQAFLASDFCQLEEVPVLLQRARRGEVRLLPIFVEPCDWENERWLHKRKMWPDPKRSWLEHDEAGRKRLLAEFAKLVRTSIDAQAGPVVDEARFDAPHPTHDLHRMPQTGSLLFGRREEIKLLDEAWNNAKTNLVVFTAGGGVGKSTLVRVWAEMLAEDEWRGAERAFAWSFYSQGTGRMTDAETFLNEALAWFGAKGWEGRSLWDRADLLAEQMRRHRTLLLLDGVEPLQSGEEAVDRGSVRDPGLRTLLEELAKGHPGLCVVTTRERLADLAEATEPAVLHRDLDQVSRLSGRALLRVARVRGTDQELEAAVADLGDHALAISLLGNLLKHDNASPHISGAKTLPPLQHPVEKGGHPRRVLEAWAQKLGDGAEVELLQIVGLFDRPADLRAVQAVIASEPLPGLNAQLRRAGLEGVADRLRKARLLARASQHEQTLDTHPIVREHFGDHLKARHPKHWSEGHRRLYGHFKDTTENRPADLAGMQPLFAAVVHGCSAGLHQEACDDVYYSRISRKASYLTRNLGAFAAELSCLSHFFAECWQTPHWSLSKPDQSWVIGQAGFLLRGLGRLREAVGPLQEALDHGVATFDWKNAAIIAGNLSELHLALGDLRLSEVRAREAVAHADTSRSLLLRSAMRTTQADSLHQLGRISMPLKLFAEAENMHIEQESRSAYLNSLQGYRYCDLILAEGRAEVVIYRAKQALQSSRESGWLLSTALGHLSLGRAYLATSPPNLAAAGSHLQEAIDGLRASGQTDFLPRGLLARASFHRMRQELPRAKKDLDAVATLVRRHGLRLFEADLALEQTRYHIAADDEAAARKTLAAARELITAMSYGRRLPELAALEAELGESGESGHAAI